MYEVCRSFCFVERMDHSQNTPEYHTARLRARALLKVMCDERITPERVIQVWGCTFHCRRIPLHSLTLTHSHTHTRTHGRIQLEKRSWTWMHEQEQRMRSLVGKLHGDLFSKVFFAESNGLRRVVDAIPGVCVCVCVQCVCVCVQCVCVCVCAVCVCVCVCNLLLHVGVCVFVCL